MLFRANTARNHLPQPRESYARHRQEMKEKTRLLLSKQSSRSSQRRISTAIYSVTSRSNNNLFKPHSQQDHYRDRVSAFTLRPQSTMLRPLTQDSGRCHRARSPLSVIKTKSKGKTNEEVEIDSITTRRQSEFLRRGSAIDKAIVSNVLKSKFNKSICASTFSYGDRPENQQLISVISNQIPKGIKDVVGVEEMLRMSHIFTGTQFKTTSLTKKLNFTINQAKAYRQQTNIADEEDAITLKSIKRW